MTKQTIEQLQEQNDFTVDLARRANVRLTRDLMQAREDLADARKVALSYLRLATKRKKKLDGYATGWADACAARDALESSRGFWLETCRAAEAERDQIRQEAQEQSDEVQEYWLSPAEAEGLRRQLAQAHEELATADFAELRRAHKSEHVEAAGLRLQLADAEAALATERQLRQKAKRRARELESSRDAWRDGRDSVTAELLKVRDWLEKTEQRAERAEALAALVTEKTADLLEHMAQANVHVSDAYKSNELAAQIREALDDSQA